MALGFLRRLLMSTGHAELQPEDARLAVAAVLVMAARADGKYDGHEAAIIDRVLGKRFGLTAELARGLREQGEEAEGEAIDIYQFTKAIKEAIPHDDRVSIIEELWGVILSDGERDPHEDSLMRQIVDRLGLSPMDSALARQKVQGGGSIPV
ncbi:MAG: TerB family tellurite resistance protein [Verrucomicrobiaceae bacterium]|nr:MAG: TerB family tellurite resistance protein [Verrucomicrobiaceae bacterium]